MNTNNENQNNQQINTNTETIELTLKELEVLVELAQKGAHEALGIVLEGVSDEDEEEANQLCKDYCFIRNKAYFALDSLKKKRAEAKKKVTTIAIQ